MSTNGMRLSLVEGETLRSSWSEDVRMADGRKVYVSTAVEIKVGAGESGSGNKEALTRLLSNMVSAHIANIQTAKGGN